MSAVLCHERTPLLIPPTKHTEIVGARNCDSDRKDPAVLSHLEAENAYAQKQTAHLEGLRDELYNEHLSHVKETDEQPPTIQGSYFCKHRAQRIYIGCPPIVGPARSLHD